LVCFFGKQSANSKESTFSVNPFPEILLAVTVPTSFLSKSLGKTHNHIPKDPSNA